MNYCSIQEAWGRPNYISNQFSSYNTQQIEHFGDLKDGPDSSVSQSDQTIGYRKKKSTSTTDIINPQKFTCQDFMDHLRQCRKCQMKMREKYAPKILENFNDMIETNRDVIVLILIGISIMIFLNLVNSISKENK